MRVIVAITFLLSLAESRRHLCDDGTRPICPHTGTRAVYNRPTGKNTKKSNYFPPPVCSGKGPAICLDGSTPKAHFNTCPDEAKKCPKGRGQGPHDKPFPPCPDGSRCKCPGDRNICKFYERRCDNKQKCHKRCQSGVPHCPWFTKNRNPHNGTRIHNKGPHRPGNRPEGHHWGKKYTGNIPENFCLDRWEEYGFKCSCLVDFPDCCNTEMGQFCPEQCPGPVGGALGNPETYCTGLLGDANNNCSILYATPFRKACCPTTVRETYKCDCCNTDDSCLNMGAWSGACDSPDSNPPCDNADWTPICPWQGNQTPTTERPPQTTSL